MRKPINTRDDGMARASELEEFFPKLTCGQPRINLYAAPSSPVYARAKYIDKA
jgi:hypothetical protein